MRPTSDRFQRMLRVSHLTAAMCELQFPDSPTWSAVPVSGGDLTLDRTAPVQRSGNVDIPWSLQAGATLGVDLRTLPFGGYCRLYRGLQYADGSKELCRLGTFRVESVSWSSDDTATLELADRMAQVRDEEFLNPYMPPPSPAITRTGTITNNATTITGLSTTAGLVVGMLADGPGIQPGSRIFTIDSGSQVTLTLPAITTTTKTGNPTAGSTVLQDVSDLIGVAVGMLVWTPSSGAIPPGLGATVTALFNPPLANGVNVQMSTISPVGGPEQNIQFAVPGYPTVTESITFGGATAAGGAATDIVRDVFGDTIGYQTLYDPAYALADTGYIGSRVDALVDISNVSGGHAFFDVNGDFVFAQQPTMTDEPVWQVDAGETGVLIADIETLDRTAVFNGVLVEGQATASDPPLSVLVTDDDPSSPTRWGGPFGKVARIERSAAVGSVDQATYAANALLDSRLGLARSLTLTAAPNPALEPGDMITVVFLDGRTETHLVDTIRIGLQAGTAQELSTRSRWAPAAAAWAPLPQARRDVYVGAAAWAMIRALETAGTAA